eukprot:CAMPEP_0178395292 /NCGR_PEP_ID=MMETSP0689_2-20121128/13143_1 /TAXON_ID=160604 /ORGANISM="Amphidinium massartii, Strain CS-259" /LENGTH=245 /DNA_ID=CAMNT_0020015941 /DNA_START=18 /DNA_END=756 /DNA_ORIENTATION=+
MKQLHAAASLDHRLQLPHELVHLRRHHELAQLRPVELHRRLRQAPLEQQHRLPDGGCSWLRELRQVQVVLERDVPIFFYEVFRPLLLPVPNVHALQLLPQSHLLHDRATEAPSDRHVQAGLQEDAELQEVLAERHLQSPCGKDMVLFALRRLQPLASSLPLVDLQRLRQALDHLPLAPLSSDASSEAVVLKVRRPNGPLQLRANSGRAWLDMIGHEPGEESKLTGILNPAAATRTGKWHDDWCEV